MRLVERGGESVTRNSSNRVATSSNQLVLMQRSTVHFGAVSFAMQTALLLHL